MSSSSSPEVGNDEEKKDDSSKVFFNYKCDELNQHATQHPGNVVEASSLASVTSIKYDYLSSIKETLQHNLLPNKSISNLQLSGILSACSSHLRYDNDKRVGFFLADGAGIGKGRQIAAIIADSLARGTERAIWLSVSNDLAVDARRDFDDLGFFGIQIIHGGKEMDAIKKKAFGGKSTGADVLFSTYQTLIGGGTKASSNERRLQQIVNWCGGESFQGCIVFDECHKAKHFVDTSVEEDKGSQTGKCVVMLQNLLPNARIIYASATGCSDLNQMAYMSRLALWGPHKVFANHDVFVKALGNRGMGSLEMLAIELKAAGLYLSRSLGFKGCDFSIISSDFTHEEEIMYNSAVQLWRDIRSSLLRLRRSDSMRHYWGNAANFFRGMIIAFKTNHCIKLVQEEVVKGNSVVIGLQHTGETHLEKFENGTSFSIIPSTLRENISNFIERHVAPLATEDPSQSVIPHEYFYKEQTRLLQEASKLNLPPASLDYIIDELGGPTKVAELTGRTFRIVKVGKKYKLQKRAESESTREKLNIEECQAFQKGKKYIAIISDAASTGISLHADNRCQSSQRRRIHITLELPWSSDKAIQQLGRTHRSNESSAPHYILLISKLAGEKRLVDAVASRLQSMGAITRGDRRASSGFNLQEFVLDSKYGRTALSRLAAKRSDETLMSAFIECGLEEEVLKWSGDSRKASVKKFLSRLLCATIPLQTILFSFFEEELNVVISNAIADGTFEKGLGEITGSHIRLVEPPQNIDGIKLHKIQVDRGVSFSAAKTLLQNHFELIKDKDKNDSNLEDSRDGSGFYISKKKRFGRTLLLLAIKRHHKQFIITRANTGRALNDMLENDLKQNYRKASLEEINPIWEDLYSKTLTSCIHGDSCKSGKNCRAGMRISLVGLLNGAIVSNWESIQRVIDRNRNMLSKNFKSMRVMRTEISSGMEHLEAGFSNKIIGVQFSLDYVHQLIASIKQQKQEVIDKYFEAREQKKSVNLQKLYNVKSFMTNVKVETPMPVNQILLKRLMKARQLKLSSFFSPVQKSSNEGMTNFKKVGTQESGKKREQEVISIIDSDNECFDVLLKKKPKLMTDYMK